MQTATNDVSTPSLSYTRQAERWILIDDLCGGTRAMQEARTRWLPKEEKEQELAYRSRLDRSILYAALSETIDTAISRPFAKPLTLQEAENLDERLREIEADCDLSGTSLGEFGAALFRDGCKYGRAHFLVDFPATNASMRLDLERRAGVRPYFTRLSPTQIIGWKAERIEGVETFTQIRYKATVIEPDGDWGEREVEEVRILTGSEWQVWRKPDKSGSFALHTSGPFTFGRVPLVTVYFKRTGVMESDPPFEPLAYLNLAHWQSYSDQRNLLRVARVPILTAVGLSAAEYDQGIVVGTSNLLKSTNENAKFGYTEHTGAALGSGREDLKDIEERMETVGMAPLTSRSGSVTATAKAIDESKSASDLEAWSRVTEAALFQGYELAAEWIGADLSEGFKVDLYGDFGLTVRAAEDLSTLDAARTRGDITRPTYLRELKRRGVLSEMVDPDEESEAAESESPPGLLSLAGSFGAAPGDGATDGDGADGEAGTAA